MFSRQLSSNNDSSRAISYINICLSHFWFYLHKNIFNHRDICCFSFFNNSDIYYIINVYSDSTQTALKYLKNTKVNIQNVLVMASDLNIRDSNWNLSFSFYSIHSDTLLDIADSFNLSWASISIWSCTSISWHLYCWWVHSRAIANYYQK